MVGAEVAAVEGRDVAGREGLELVERDRLAGTEIALGVEGAQPVGVGDLRVRPATSLDRVLTGCRAGLRGRGRGMRRGHPWRHGGTGGPPGRGTLGRRRRPFEHRVRRRELVQAEDGLDRAGDARGEQRHGLSRPSLPTPGQAVGAESRVERRLDPSDRSTHGKDEVVRRRAADLQPGPTERRLDRADGGARRPVAGGEGPGGEVAVVLGRARRRDRRGVVREAERIARTEGDAELESGPEPEGAIGSRARRDVRERAGHGRGQCRHRAASAPKRRRRRPPPGARWRWRPAARRPRPVANRVGGPAPTSGGRWSARRQPGARGPRRLDLGVALGQPSPNRRACFRTSCFPNGSGTRSLNAVRPPRRRSHAVGTGRRPEGLPRWVYQCARSRSTRPAECSGSPQQAAWPPEHAAWRAPRRSTRAELSLVWLRLPDSAGAALRLAGRGEVRERPNRAHC